MFISTCAVPMKFTEILVGFRRRLIDGIVGLVLCKLAYLLQDMSMAVSIQSLMVIAIDRYRGIVFPFRPAITTPKRCKVIISLIWLSSMGLHDIYFYTFRLVSHNDTKIYSISSWEPEFDLIKTQEQYITVLLVFVMLPFPILTLLYTIIIFGF